MIISAKMSYEQEVKQKFTELLAALPITTVGRGLAPAGRENDQICTALRRIRAIL